MMAMNNLETLEAGRDVDVQLNGFTGLIYGVRLSPCRSKWTNYCGFEHAVNAGDMWAPNAFTEARAVINKQQGLDA